MVPAQQQGLHKFFASAKVKPELGEPQIVVLGDDNAGTGTGNTGRDAHGASGGPVPCQSATGSQHGSGSSGAPPSDIVGGATSSPCEGRGACDMSHEEADSDSEELPPIGLQWACGEAVIPVVDAECKPAETSDPDAVHGSLFFKLEWKTKWVFKCLKKIPRLARAAAHFTRKGGSKDPASVRSITQLPTYNKLSDAINASFGRRTKTVSKVDVNRKPFGGNLITIQLDGVTMKCLPMRRPITILISNESVQWVLKSVIHDLTHTSNVKVEKHPKTTAADFLEQEDVDDLRAHNVKFWPSKRLFVGISNSGNAIKEKAKIRRRNNKRFKRQGGSAYQSDVTKKLKAAKSRICCAVAGASPTVDGQTDDAGSSGGESGADNASSDS